MKKVKQVVLGVVLVFLVFNCKAKATEKEWEKIPGLLLDLETVVIGSKNKNVVLVGGRDGVARSDDGGRNWEYGQGISGLKGKVLRILAHPQNQNTFYAVGDSGFYVSLDEGNNWKRVFTITAKNDSCYSAVVLRDRILLGTKKGLFVTRGNSWLWQRVSGKLGDSPIFVLANLPGDPNFVFSLTDTGLFRSQDKGESWSQIFVVHKTDEGVKASEAEEYLPENEEKGFRLNFIQVDPNSPNRVYLATSSGVYKSDDRGDSWSRIITSGLIQQDVKKILVAADSQLFTVTKAGIFGLGRGHWQELSLGLFAQIKDIVDDDGGNIYAATDKGLFRTKFSTALNKDFCFGSIAKYSEAEPSIQQVQQAAIEYAEVQPEKIILWRKLAAKKALLPRLEIGMDIERDRTVSSSIWGTYGSNGASGKYFVGPDDTTRYRNNNWKVSLTWELSDLIWNNEQTSIDVRSRLMVELRDEIVNEVTKLYFERLRVKIELDNLTLAEKKKISEKALRLKELEAYIDGLTGGFFSRNCNKNL